MHREDLIITTPWSESEEARKLAIRLARRFAAQVIPRGDRSIVELCTDAQVDMVLVADSPPKLYHRLTPSEPLFFHPGMAMQRVLRLGRGERDRLLQAAMIEKGDKVIDATLGLGTDALVLSAGVGEEGQVIACESSSVLAKLFQVAIEERSSQPDWLAVLLGRVAVWERNHQQALQELPDKSVDVVYFDPMFQTPSSQPSSIDRMRVFAEGSPLTESVLREAKRVSRRTVVVKERLSSGVFERFGLTPDKPRSRFSYGVLKL